jgi:hypothetical protein
LKKVIREGEAIRMGRQSFVGELQGILGRPSTGGKTLKRILRNHRARVWNGFNWFNMRPNSGLP